MYQNQWEYIVGLGPGGLGFLFVALRIQVPFIKGSQISKPPGPKPLAECTSTT